MPWVFAMAVVGLVGCTASESDVGDTSLKVLESGEISDAMSGTDDSAQLPQQDSGAGTDLSPEGPDTLLDSVEISDAADATLSPDAEVGVDPQDVPPETPWAVYLPGQAGPYTFKKTVHNIQVSEGQGLFQPDKENEVFVFAPEGAGKAPGLVFFPGFQLSADNFVYIGEHMASHGFVVLIPTIGDSLFNADSHVELAGRVSIFLDWLEENESVDPNRLVAGGHSRGGKVAILASLDESRIMATFNLDPVDTGAGPLGVNAENPSVTPEMMDKLVIPAGFVGAGKGGNGAQPCAPKEDNYHEYFVAAKQAFAVEYLLKSAGHNDFAQSVSFTLDFFCEKGDDPEEAKAIAKSTMVAFYQVFLNGDDAYRPWVDGEEAPSAAEITVSEP